MGKLLKATLFALLVTALVWAAVVWHWQRTQHTVQANDLLMYLVLLPALVVGGALALRWAWRRAAAADAARAAAAPAAVAASGNEAAVAAPQAVALRVLAHAVVLPGADDAVVALDLAAQRPPVNLDPSLRDLDGMGVFTRRCSAADPETEDGAARALRLADACLEPVLAALMQRHAERQEHEAVPPEPGHPSIVASRQGRAPAPRSAVRVWWAVAEPVDDTLRLHLEQALAARLAEWAKAMPLFDWSHELVATAGGERLLWQAERRLHLVQREARDETLLLVAADSWIDASRVARLDAAAQLFTAQRQPGVMPGEGAAALWLAPPAAPRATHGDGAAPGVALHRIALLRRDKSADAGGRIAANELTEAIVQVLAAAGHDAQAVGAVVSDTDLRPSRSGEFHAAMQAALPHLSPAEQCLGVGVVAGATGLAGAPIALALAAECVRRDGAPALALAQADGHDRLAALLTPSAAVDAAAEPSIPSKSELS